MITEFTPYTIDILAQMLGKEEITIVHLFSHGIYSNIETCLAMAEGISDWLVMNQNLNVISYGCSN